MRLITQLGIGAVLVIGLAGGGVVYHRSQVDGEAEAAVRRGARAITVEVTVAEAGTMLERIEAVGSTLARQAVDIVAMNDGRIVEIAFTPGQQVSRDTVLVRLDDEAERADVAEAEAVRREAELALNRARQLRQNNTVAQATVDELEAAYLGTDARLDAAKKRLSDRTVRAPFAGVVGIRGADIGARVDDETVLTTIDDLGEVEIEFNVPEIFFGRVRLGQVVEATSSAWPGRTFDGQIATIDSRVGQQSRAFRVRAVLPNPDLELPAGMFMHVSVVLDERPAVLIPEQAVLAEGDRTYVFTVDEDRATRREVDLGQRDRGAVEVLGGLQAGQQVVNAGLQRLRNGAAVRVSGEADSNGGGG